MYNYFLVLGVLYVFTDRFFISCSVPVHSFYFVLLVCFGFGLLGVMVTQCEFK